MTDSQLQIALIALGKIGLPLAVQFASQGHKVVGVDVNSELVDAVNKGVEPFPGEHMLGEKLRNVVSSGHLTATTDYSQAVPQADAVVVVVPLFVNDETWQPEFGWMDSATESIGSHLTPGTLVSYETTLPVGTTRNRWKPKLESISGLVEGEDFHVVFSPERVLTGRVFEDLRKYPKLVGGLSETGVAEATRFYEAVLEFDDRPDLHEPNGVWNLGTAEASELAKLAETTYRDVNIALANQFALFAEGNGIDVRRVIEASNSQPFSHIHQPGIAVGGHCIPVYPRLYLYTDPEASVVDVARRANAEMPEHCVRRLAEAFGGSLAGKKVLVLGASYRGGVKETAFSGVFPAVSAIQSMGGEAFVHDPMYSPQEIEAMGLTPGQYSDDVQGVIVQADHAEYRGLTSENIPTCEVLFDGRAVTANENWPGVNRIVIGLGN